MEQYADFNWQEAAVKGRMKKEIYTILAMRGKYYLSPKELANSEYIHDIMAGRKQVSCLLLNHIRFLNKTMLK